MSHLFVSVFVLVFTLLGFNRLYCLNGVNAAYLGLYKGLIEDCVVLASNSGGYLSAPLIYAPKLMNDLEDYYETNLAPYVKDYVFTCVSLDGRVGRAGKDYWSSAKITFEAEIDDLLTVKKVAIFQIERTDVQ